MQAVSAARLAEIAPTPTIVQLCQWQEVEAEVDEMWSFVQAKAQQRWLWHAIDRSTGEVLADVLSDHKDTAFVQLKALLEPFGITQFYSDDYAFSLLDDEEKA